MHSPPEAEVENGQLWSPCPCAGILSRETEIRTASGRGWLWLVVFTQEVGNCKGRKRLREPTASTGDEKPERVKQLGPRPTHHPSILLATLVLSSQGSHYSLPKVIIRTTLEMNENHASVRKCYGWDCLTEWKTMTLTPNRSKGKIYLLVTPFPGYCLLSRTNNPFYGMVSDNYECTMMCFPLTNSNHIFSRKDLSFK